MWEEGGQGEEGHVGEGGKRGREATGGDEGMTHVAKAVRVSNT